MAPIAGKTIDTAAAGDEVLEWAGRAPSVHNTQPWAWRVLMLGTEIRAGRPRKFLGGPGGSGVAGGAQVLPIEQETTKAQEAGFQLVDTGRLHGGGSPVRDGPAHRGCVGDHAQHARACGEAGWDLLR
ncbi:MAG: hypothetical protein QOF53_1890 [Nocardioidaceae bacterium]|nr:hypothetical protein [Nocardioidaceae bacterium]